MNYNNVKIVPRQLSEISSRDDVDPSVTFGDTKLRLPILISPMNTITGIKMSKLFAQNGLMGCLPRMGTWNNSIDTYINTHENCIVSLGLDDFSIAEDFYNYGDIKYFLVDTANGFSTNVESIIRKLKTLKDVFVIAGNVCSREGFQYMADLGVDAVRVGIGVGSACLTTVNTGIGQGIVSSIIECYESSLEMKQSPLIIADGEVQTVSDIAKALAIGADLVMCGGMFAGTKETPGKIIVHNGEKYKTYHGSASYANQTKYKKTPFYIEGMETMVKYKGSAQRVIGEIDAGLRSALSYMGTETITEFKENCQKKESIKYV